MNSLRVRVQQHVVHSNHAQILAGGCRDRRSFGKPGKRFRSLLSILQDTTEQIHGFGGTGVRGNEGASLRFRASQITGMEGGSCLGQVTVRRVCCDGLRSGSQSAKRNRDQHSDDRAEDAGHAGIAYGMNRNVELARMRKGIRDCASRRLDWKCG